MHLADLRPSFRKGPLAAALIWLLAVWLVGPWLLLAGVLLLAWPRFRAWIRPDRPWRLAGGLTASALLVAGLVVVIPDGWLPLPSGPGVLTSSSYVGRAATPNPVNGYDVPPHPALSANGTNSMHNDGWASDAYPWAGPLGDRVEVDTAWYGIEECATLAFDTEGRLIALCGDLTGPIMHVLDPESMRKQSTLRLPDRPSVEGTRPWENLCGGAYFYLDHADRAIVATTDRRVVVVETADSRGRPDLVQTDGYDLSGSIPADDCLIALMPAAEGRIWFLTKAGLVGTVDAVTRQVHVHDVGEEMANSFAVDVDGSAYIVSDTALYRFDTGTAGIPEVTWRTTYDRGVEKKPGQLTQGSGTTPTLLSDGMVAITDNADPRMNVVFLDREGGEEICRAPVFSDGASATENSLVGLGTGVIVENNHGYKGPQSTILGRTTAGGFARVDVDGGECVVRWTNDETAPTSVPKASLANGLVYAYTKRTSWWGVAAWYVTATDVHTGRRVFSVRTGRGILANNHYAATTIAPDGALFIATLGGMVRVRDRR